MFFLKKVIGSIIMPLPMAVIMIVCSVALYCWVILKKNRGGIAGGKNNLLRIARVLLILAGIIIVLASNSVVANLLIAPLEQRYPAYAGQPVNAVLVLGSLHRSGPNVPVTSYLENDAMVRLAEGIRIALMNEQAKLIVSGPGYSDAISQAEAYRQVAISLGFPADRIVLLESGRDTFEEMQGMKKIVGDKPFALATSAYHMPRSMLSAKRNGLKPIAAPTWHKVKISSQQAGTDFWFLLPGTRALTMTQRALHEYLGLVWYQLVDRV